MKHKYTNNLKKEIKIEGDIYTDNIHKLLYATDASAYRQIPYAVARPKNKDDIKKIISYAKEKKTSVIPRAAGTSLAGQVVGGGIIVDISKYMNKILEINAEKKYAWVEAGIVLDELNKKLADKGLFFSPEASTANRCTIGGMFGNNACGLHSLKYGSTRDHILAAKVILSDNSEVEFGNMTQKEFNEKCKIKTLEGKIYRQIRDILSSPKNKEEIKKGFPDENIPRRNTGYALDLLLNTNLFSDKITPFNFCKLLAGSEGTLSFFIAIKINLTELPPKQKAIVVPHFSKLEDAFKANLTALKHKPNAIELMDKTIIKCAAANKEQKNNSYFIKDLPEAVLMIEFTAETKDELERKIKKLKQDLTAEGYGEYFSVVYNEKTTDVWKLRKAGLGVLSNMPGDAKPVSVIEDTAVQVEKLPEYMQEFGQLIKKHKLECVYHAHIGTGELHLRPVLNLKDKNDILLFRTIAKETALIVKKYGGSLSGEHGDGRLRGEFIPLMMGEHNYNIFKEIKKTWDKENIFNPQKIVNTPLMNTSLRLSPKKNKPIKTYFDFSDVGGIQRASEKCNGSGDCRKSEKIGGTMCPSFMATRDEKHGTRARANIMREFLTNSPKNNKFDHKEIYEVMDLCLSCKACKTECPSSVDIAKLKAEFLQHYYDKNGIALRSLLIANITKINELGRIAPKLYNKIVNNISLIMKIVGFSDKRKFPLLSDITLRNWLKKNEIKKKDKKVCLFIDEFTNHKETELGIKTVRLLQKLGYEVRFVKHKESGRTFLSKGMVKKAKKTANANVEIFSNIISDKLPLVGIEPSAILSFRDEYISLATKENKQKAIKLSENTFMSDEFLKREMQAGNIKKEQFTDVKQKIKLHGHCHQKSLASTECTKYILSFPEKYEVEEIPSGCCGMAGSFGFEKEHYEVSMKIGELVLFPAVRAAGEEYIIAAPGTSCRHQIKDGTGKKALHPIEILFDALRNK